MQTALEAIYRQHRQGLFTLALSVTRRADLAEDAVHEAFVRLCQARPGGDAVAYAFAAVRNAAVDQLRRQRPTQPAESIFEHASVSDEPADAAIRRERAAQLTAALDELDEEDRVVIVLRLYAELTFEQTAQTLGKPLPAVTSRYRRALDKLRQKVQALV